jgi:outer membrane protein
VRRAYFAARAERALIAVQQETLDNQVINQREIATFVRVGVRPEIDLLQAQTDLANARVALLAAQNRYRVAKATLRQAIGWRESGPFEVGDDEMPAVPEESRALPLLVDQAFDNRPELQALLRQRASALATARAARAGYLPTLAAEGGIAKTGTQLDELNTSWDVGVTLTWQLFQGGLTSGELDEAQALAEIQASELEATRLQVQFEVEQAKAVIEDNQAALSAANEALRLARTQLTQAQRRYQQGVSNIVELRDAQLAVTSASAQLVQAELNVSTARAQLIAALGAKP